MPQDKVASFEDPAADYGDLPDNVERKFHRSQLLEPVSVSVQDLYVTYNLTSAPVTLRKGTQRQKAKVSALSGISLEIHAGEALGVLGKNGSGKSTLLRAIAGLETPARGDVLATSRPTLLGVSAVLEPDLSGLKNIRLACLALGLSPNELDDKIDEIVEFSGIGDAINYPMRTYSSGMGARLRFAIATACDPEILLVDEALATGDSEFRERSLERMHKMIQSASTFMLVSHSPKQIGDFCSRAIWLHDGKIIGNGDANLLSFAYRKWSYFLASGRKSRASELLEEQIDYFTTQKFN